MGEPGKFSTTLVFGLGAALSMMLVTFGTYRAGPETFLGPAAYLGNAVIILLAAAAAFIRKRANGGVLGFRPALKAAFSVLVLGVFGQYLFTWLLLNTIDPHFRDTLLPVIAKNSEAAYRKFGMPEDQIKRALDGEKGQSIHPRQDGDRTRLSICYKLPHRAADRGDCQDKNGAATALKQINGYFNRHTCL